MNAIEKQMGERILVLTNVSIAGGIKKGERFSEGSPSDTNKYSPFASDGRAPCGKSRPGGIYTIERLTNRKVSSFSRKTNNQFPALPCGVKKLVESRPIVHFFNKLTVQ